MVGTQCTPLFLVSVVGVPSVFCFETSVPEGRGGEIGGDGTNQNKSPEMSPTEAKNNSVVCLVPILNQFA